MLSSMCQHVAKLQFDSCAEKDSLCGCRHQCFSVVGKQQPRFAQGQPKDDFQLKELHRTTSYCPNECRLKGGEGLVC